MKPSLSERNIRIFQDVIRGHTYEEIGQKYGLAASTVTQIFRRYTYGLQEPKEDETEESLRLDGMRQNADYWLARAEDFLQSKTPSILFSCDGADVYADGDDYKDVNGLTFLAQHSKYGIPLLSFDIDSDIPVISGCWFDLLLQCLEHRLASRNLAEPMFERTNALEHLRRMRVWLAEIAKKEKAGDILATAPDDAVPTY